MRLDVRDVTQYAPRPGLISAGLVSACVQFLNRRFDHIFHMGDAIAPGLFGGVEGSIGARRHFRVNTHFWPESANANAGCNLPIWPFTAFDFLAKSVG